MDVANTDSFFAGVCIFGIPFITGEKVKTHRHVILILVIIFSVMVGALRYYTEKPFPTAFFLLIGVAILGVNYTDCEKGTMSNTEMLALIIEFEIGLVIAVILSYTDMVFEYIFAYNVGLIMFAAAKKKKLNNEFFIRLGEVGFVFFLGASIPYELLKKFISFESSLLLQIVGCAIKFLMAYVFAVVMTKYVEQPILNKVRKMELALK